MKNSTPDRLACVNLPAFPLQLLLKRHPDWIAHPAAVVAEDKPQGLILWVNEKARRSGILPGFRYAAGFSLNASLRAGEVPKREIDSAVKALTRELIRFSPEVEASRREPGVFWLSAKGLRRLYASPKKWAEAFQARIHTAHFHAAIVVGFSRFGTYAVAKEKNGITIFRDPAEERSEAQKISLARFDLDPDFRDTLFKLGIRTVGGLLSLPGGGLRERFGAEAHRLYRMAAGDLWTPLRPSAPEEPVEQKQILDDPESDSNRLLFIIKQLLHPMLAALAGRAQALATLWMSLLIDRADWLKEEIRPAAPTLETIQILDLIRLRLESLALSAGIIEIHLHAEPLPATREQLRLFVEHATRDLDAANRALARLRAEFGDKAVVQARLEDGHLPEARFSWQPLQRLDLPKPRLNDSAKNAPDASPLTPDDSTNPNRSSNERKDGLNSLNGWNGLNEKVLVRRIAAKPILLPGAPRPTHEDGWLLLGHEYGSVDKLIGPYIISGGWWNREIHREYYYAETRRGDLLWIYYDRMRRRWFLQGWIE
ncbi:MAG TPA: DNA polymerase Y family protein [Candidatus Binatia bacterium]